MTQPLIVLARGLLTAVFTLVFVAPSAEARPLKLDDLWKLQVVTRAYAAPDGRHLLLETLAPHERAGLFDDQRFVMTERARLSLVDSTASHPVLQSLAPGSGVIALGFSPSGRKLAIGKVRGRALQLGVVTVATGRIVWPHLLILPPRNGPSVAWLTDITLLALTPLAAPQIETFPAGAPGQERLQLLRRRQMSGALSGPRITGSGRFAEVSPTASRLVELQLASGKLRRLAEGAFDDLAPSPSKRFLAMSAPAEAPPMGRLEQVNPSDGRPRRRLSLMDLTTGRITRPCPTCDLIPTVLDWAPAQDRLLIFARDDADRTWIEGAYREIDPLQGSALRLDVPGFTPAVTLTPGEFFPIVHGGWEGSAPVLSLRSTTEGSKPARFQLNSAGPTRLGDPPPAYPIGLGVRQVVAANPGGAAATRPTPDGGSILVRAGGAELVEERDQLGVIDIALRRGGRVYHLARFNGHLSAVEPAIVVSLPRKTSSGLDGLDWLYAPSGAAASPGRFPLIVVPYIGASYPQEPRSQLLGQDPPPIVAQVLTGLGFAVLIPALPRGPHDEPASHITTDVLAAVDAAVATGRIDPDRVAVWGHSFGAYTGLVLATETDRFRAIVAEDGAYDLASHYGQFSADPRARPSEIAERDFGIGYDEAGQGGMLSPPWRDPERYRRNSPVFAADRIHTPVMLICGDQDFYDIGQNEEMFSALRRQDKDAQLVVFPGEGHVPQSPPNQAAIYRLVTAFLRQAFTAPPPAPRSGPPSPGAKSRSPAD